MPLNPGEQRDAFIAITMPPIIEVQLAAAGRMLQIGLQGTVKVRTQGEPHLTLRYIGDSTTHKLKTLLTNFALHNPEIPAAFNLTVEGIDAFPDTRRPEVVWAGVGGDTERLREIQATLDQVALEDGVPQADYPFTPHITIAKLPAEGLTAAQTAAVRNVLAELRRDPPFYPPHNGWSVTELTAMAKSKGRSDVRFESVAYASLTQK